MAAEIGTLMVEEKTGEYENHLHHGQAYGSVLELGIVVHSLIIGISLGASEHSKIIKPLVVALTFHKFFQGMGLGGCISPGWGWAYRNQGTTLGDPLVGSMFEETTGSGTINRWQL
ncbi:hypothetical protein Golob_012989, partial [Gossypium lobatum]|nr:hypothetical protein [Gossypium lobatum]